MADEALVNKIRELSDLELAALTCLVAQEHCIIDTEPSAVDELVQELELIASKIFGFTPAVIDCSEHTTLDDFAYGIITIEGSPEQSSTPVRTRHDSQFGHSGAFQSRGSTAEGFTDSKTIANIVIAKNLDEAPKQVQTQAFELLRSKRIYTRTSVHHTPKPFLFIALLAGGQGPRLTRYLNNLMFISHFHHPGDGFPNLEELAEGDNDAESISSVVKKSPTYQNQADFVPRITVKEIERLTELMSQVTVSIDVRRYLQDIVSFLRVHRAVGGGINATATKHFEKLARCLTALHGLPYATPSIIGLATRKIYMHRIIIVKPENERSMQWGSDLGAVTAMLEGMGPDDVIEDVLGSWGPEVPL